MNVYYERQLALCSLQSTSYCDFGSLVALFVARWRCHQIYQFKTFSSSCRLTHASLR